MEIKIYFLFIILATQAVPSFNNRYCRVSKCPHGTHTMCLFNKTEPNERCNRVIRSGLTESERRIILSEHNYYRDRIYNGVENRGNPGPQPAAVVRAPLQWDNELETIAHRWANQCLPFSDSCRHVDQYFVGQNLIFNDFDEDMDEEVQLIDLQELVGLWYNQVVRFNNGLVENFNREAARLTGTLCYSQLAWANTTRIGCSAMRYQRNLAQVPKIFFLCNYAPTGNCNGDSMYETLPPEMNLETDA